jgi:hypothetical protein
MLRAFFLLGLMIVALPARAADLPPEVDHLLWCSSAFYWLSADASDAGQSAEADSYDQWSDLLSQRAATALTALGYSPEEISDLGDSYDNAVVNELKSPQGRYDPASCAAFLVD